MPWISCMANPLDRRFTYNIRQFHVGASSFPSWGILPKNAPKCWGCRRTTVDKNDYVVELSPRKRWIF